MEKLEFLKTMSADEFKAAQRVARLEILRNASTGKCFFAFGSNRGAVTSRYPNEPLTEPMVSEVVGSDGTPFYLLHNRGEGAVTKMQTL